MLDLHRLRLLHELHARGTVAAVADALHFTPSAVSQQLAVLEREAGVPLLERAGRSVRLTGAALGLVDHASALLEREQRARADLAAATGRVTGRGRIASFQSVALHVALPALRALARDAPELRCELVEAEPERSLPALVLGDVDLVLADEWDHQPLARPAAVVREDLWREPVLAVLPAEHAVAHAHPGAVPLAALAGAAWATGHDGTAWAAMTTRTCRDAGGFDPDLRHRVNDSVTCLALVRDGRAVALLPALALPRDDPRLALRAVAGGEPGRTILAATRAVDAARPSTHALLAAVRAAAAAAAPRGSASP